MHEIECLIPAIAQIFKTVAEMREFTNVRQIVQKFMIEEGTLSGQSRNSEDESAVKYQLMNLQGTVKFIQGLVTDMIESKKNAVLRDNKELAHDIFEAIQNK